MGSESLINQVLSAWENSNKRLPIEELCVDCPELIPEIRSRIDKILAADRFVRAQSATTLDNVGSNADTFIEVSIKDYRLVRLLGGGGQADVYQAVFLKTGRQVAIKVLREGALANERMRARFDREARILAALNHPSIVTVLDRGLTENGKHYLAMDYIAGKPLDKYLRDRHTFSGVPALRDLLGLFLRICDAMNAAHLRGVVHRDLKPADILVDERGDPHIVDFGLARSVQDEVAGEGRHVVTMTGQFLGSLPWASPEQAEGDPDKIDIRTDVYSLGVILYQLLTGGHFPYEVGTNLREVLNNILTAVPQPLSKWIEASETRSRLRRQWRRPSIPPEVEAIVLKALAKSREQRYQSAGDLARDIADYLAGKPTTALSTAQRRRRSRARRITVAAFILALFAATGAILVVRPGWYHFARSWISLLLPVPETAQKPEPLPDDPRVQMKPRVTELVGRIRWRLNDLKSLKSSHAAALESRMAAFQARLRGLIGDETSPPPPWTVHTHKDIIRETDAVEAELQSLDKELHTTWLEAIQRWRTEQLNTPFQSAQPSDALTAAFDKHCRLILSALASPADNPSALSSTHQQLDALRGSLQAIDASLATVAPSTRPTPRPWQADLAPILAKHREQTLHSIVSSPGWTPAPAAAIPRAALDGYQRWLRDVAEVTDGLGRIEELLDTQLTLEARKGDGQSGLELYEKCTRSPAFADVKPAAAPLIARIERLRSIHATDRLDDLVATIKRAANDPTMKDEVLLSAWRRLGQVPSSPPWPRSVAELKQELEIQARLEEVQGGKYRGELDAARRHRLEQCARIAPLDQLLDLVAGQRDRLKADVDVLPWLSYNLLVRHLKNDPPQEEKAAREALKTIEKTAESVQGGLGKTIHAMATRAMTGPGSLVQGTSSDWNYPELDSSAGPYWLLTHSQSNLLMNFIPIPDKNNPLFFMSGTEVTLGQFMTVISLCGKWDDFTSLLTTPSGRKEPILWEFRRGQVLPVEPGLRIDLAVDVLRDSLTEYPMQYISPAAAVHFAGLLNCRLPTAEEWQIAYRKHLKDISTANGRHHKWKLRWKEAWDRQIAYSRESRQGVVWLDDGIFRPQQIGAVPQHEAAGSWTREDVSKAATLPDMPVFKLPEPVRHQDNETAFFRRVCYGTDGYPLNGSLNDVVGNVAEYVFEWDTVPEPRPGPGRLDAWMKKYGDQVRIVGGSVLSPPQLRFTEAYKVDPQQAARGFSDVGFRLVHDVVPLPLPARLRRVLNGLDYVRPPAPAGGNAAASGAASPNRE